MSLSLEIIRDISLSILSMLLASAHIICHENGNIIEQHTAMKFNIVVDNGTNGINTEIFYFPLMQVSGNGLMPAMCLVRSPYLKHSRIIGDWTFGNKSWRLDLW